MIGDPDCHFLKGKTFHDAISKVDQLRKVALREDLPVGLYAVSQMFKKYPITSSIIGIKNKEQMKFFEGVNLDVIFR